MRTLTLRDVALPEPLALACARRGAKRQRESAPSTATVRFQEASANRKLAPQKRALYYGHGYQTPQAPFCSSTYVSIQATCPATCPFKGAGCYVDAGYTRRISKLMDAAAVGKSSLDVIREEVAAIDGAFGGGAVPQDGAQGGRDLRLHIGGDVGNAQGARLLAGAVRRWRKRGGGAVWVYTHLWREVNRIEWGAGWAVHASVENGEEVAAAWEAGYKRVVLVVQRFPQGGKAFRVPGAQATAVPCPAELEGATCVQCRRCLDNLLPRGMVTAFAIHGTRAAAAAHALAEASGAQGRLKGVS